MTFRPADVSAKVWSQTMLGHVERLNRAYAKVYCELIPKPYRHRLRWTIDYLGLFGLPVAAMFSAMLRFLPSKKGDVA